MRRLLALLLLLPALASAQRPRWDVWRRTEDQFGPWEMRGPRVGIQAVRAGVGAETYRALRSVSVPPTWAAPSAFLLSGVAPHVAGVAAHRYPFDGADWAADAVIAGGPAIVLQQCERKNQGSRRGRGWARCARVTAVYVAGWALAAGWASP